MITRKDYTIVQTGYWQGLSVSAIVVKLGKGHKTVRKYLRMAKAWFYRKADKP